MGVEGEKKEVVGFNVAFLGGGGGGLGEHLFGTE